ncbi:MAG TPA: adenosine kinase [bacterium]|nr:adenosine kinase [bacterium]
MKKIIGVGNSLVDILIKIPDISFLNEFNLAKGSMSLVDYATVNKILNRVEKYITQKSAGGSAANTINGLAKLGVSTAFIGKTGKDKYGVFFRDDLKKNGVVEKMFDSPTETGRVAALITPDSERTFATYLGASIELTEKDLTPDLFKNYEICYIEGYLVQNHKLVEAICEYAADNNCEICIDLASYNVVAENKSFLTGIIEKYVDIVFANEDEAREITGYSSPEKAVKHLAKSVNIAVVKIGAKGSMIQSKETFEKIGTIAAKAIDTTGAGDLYAAGFLYGYVNNYSLCKSAEIGAITGGKVVEVIGAKMSDDTWADIKSQIKKIK